MRKLLISINPDLKNEWGHYLHYDECLRHELGKEGSDLMILASREVDSKLKERDYILPRMTHPSNHFFLFKFKKKRFSSILNFWKNSVRFARDINCRQKNNKKVTYFMYLASFEHLLGFFIHSLYNRFRYRYGLNLFYFHFNIGSYSKTPLTGWKSILLRIAKITVKLFRIRLCTDSQELNLKLRVNFDILPMFSTTQFDKTDFEESKKMFSDMKKNAGCIVSFPGLMRKGKGYDKSCELINHIISNNDDRFFFYIRKVTFQEGKDMMAYLNRIEKKQDFVRIFEGILSGKEYKELFSHSDIIFISYRREEFHTRTSAVLSDALILKKPVVGPKATWLGNIIEKYSFGKTYEDGNIEEMYSALQEVYNNYSFYKKNLDELAEDWLGQQNPAKAVKFILR